jgi:hypothetical protein
MKLACVLSLLLMTLSGGCLSGKRLSDIGASPTARAQSPGPIWTIPTGVSIPASLRGATNIDGLYPSFVANDKMCCWVGTHARVVTLKPAPAAHLDLTVYVPDYPFFAKHKQGLAISIDGDRTQRRCCYGPGVYTLSFDVPPRLRQRRGDVSLQLSTTEEFVPMRERISADPRHLGIVLTRVDYMP